MAVLSKASATAVLDLKSATLTVLAVVIKTLDLAALSQAMRLRFDNAPGFFGHEPVCLDFSAVREADEVPDFEALLALLRQHGLNPIAVRGGGVAQMAAGLAAGLAEAPDPIPPGSRPVLVSLPVVTPPAAVDATAPPIEPEDLVLELDSDEAAATLPPTRLTLVHDKPLRSGQRLYAKGGDLVVLGLVNFGAEVIADGSIHVYGPLRGRAIAGACGDSSARIFALNMQPQLVSIAGHWRTLEEGAFPDAIGQMAQVRLDGERLLMEPMNTGLKTTTTHSERTQRR